MGLGDWIMATSQIKTLHEQHKLPVVVVGVNGRVQWSPVFENNPKVLRSVPVSRMQQYTKLLNGPGMRPYVERKDEQRFVWKPWPIAPGEIFLAPHEKALGTAYARGYVLIEPNVKVPGSNKEWPRERWQALVDSMPDVKFMQAINQKSLFALSGIKRVRTETFRNALAMIAYSRAFVGTEGALHHAAAAFGVPAVVLFSEYISPAITGYPQHANIWHATVASGRRVPCPTCRASMASITVEEVQTNLRRILDAEGLHRI